MKKKNTVPKDRIVHRVHHLYLNHHHEKNLLNLHDLILNKFFKKKQFFLQTSSCTTSTLFSRLFVRTVSYFEEKKTVQFLILVMLRFSQYLFFYSFLK